MSDNVFDQLDPPRPTPGASSGNVFDQLDPPARPVPKALTDLAASRKTAAPAPAGYSAADIPKAIASGVVSGIGSTIGGIGDFGQMAARPVVKAVNAVADTNLLPTPVNPFAAPAAAVSGVGERIAASESEAAKASEAKPIISGDITKPETLALGEGAKDPMALALGGANLVGEAVPMLAGGLEARLAKVAPELAEHVPGILAKLSAGEALSPAETAIAQAVKDTATSAGKRAVASGAAIGGMQGAEGSAEGERARIQGLSQDDIAKLPGYQSRIAKGMTPDQARADLADETAQNVFAATLPVATAAGAVGTAPLVHGAQEALTKLAGASALKRAAAGAAIEAPVQGLAGAAQNAASIEGANTATGENRDLTEGSAAAAATGAALGAGFGAFGAAVTKPEAAPKVRFPDAVPGSLADAANAVGETPREAAAAGREPEVPPATEPAAAGSLADAAATLTPRQAPDVPWIDHGTGEFRRPTDDEVKDAFHTMFESAADAGAGMQRTAASRMLSEEWGVPRDRLQVLRKDALAERNEGFKPGDKRSAVSTEETTPAQNASNEANTDQAGSGTPVLGAHEAAVPEPEGSGLSAVRGARDNGVPAVDGLQDVPAGHGAATDAEALDRQAGQQRELRAGELPVGDSAGAGVESSLLSPRAGERPSGDDRGSGAAERSGADDGKAALPSGENTRGLAAEDAAARPEELALSDDQRRNADGSGVGEADRNLTEDDGRASQEGHADRTAAAAAPSRAEPSEVDAAAREAAAHPENDLKEPSAAQQAANNAKAGHVNLHGLDVTIQVPKGGMRRGADAKGNEWERRASDHYGHIRGTEGADGEQIDVYLGPHAEDPNAKVFVIDQVKPGTKTFDETKSMVGYDNGRAARASYQANFPRGMRTFGGIREMSMGEFKTWAREADHTKPASDATTPSQKGVRESKATLAARVKARAEAEAPPIEAGVGDAAETAPVAAGAETAAAPSIRTSTVPREAGDIVAQYRNDRPIKADPDYKAAKSGDGEAAQRLVERHGEEVAAQAVKRFGSDVTFVAPHAEEGAGRNAIPHTLAEFLAARTGGRADEGIVQSNRPRHTGANAMERLISRSEFDGPVEKGRKYVLVDDVSTSGSTFADLAHHIQENGGKVAGAVSLVNASRSGKIHADERVTRQIEGRHGDEIRKQFGIDPRALTAEEAKYLIGFRTADELRNRAASAAQERAERVSAKEVQREQVTPPPEKKPETNAPPSEGRSALGAPRDRILLADKFDPADAKELLGEKPLSKTDAVQALRDLRGDQTITKEDLAGIRSTRVGKSERYGPVDLARAARETWRSARNMPNEPRGEFRQGADEHTAAEPKLAEIKQAIRDVVGKWGPDAPSVRVVDSPEQLPAAAKGNPRYETARGFYDGKTAYIVASNHADAASALRSVAHEAIGHYGVDRIVDEFGKGGMDQLVGDITRLRENGVGSTAMRSVIDDVAKRYPNADAREFAREVIAVMAERGVRNGVIGRVITAARAMLRKLFPNLSFSENDIRSMLSRSEEYLRTGPSLDQRQELVRNLAFDQPAEAAGLTPGERNNPNTVADAARAWREEGTDSPYFQKFFEGSKVVDRKGEPAVVYHGTASDHTVFKDTVLGDATGHSTSPLGHFFTENRALAERYAENASDGVPADERVVEAYLGIKKPYEMTLEQAQGIETQAEARALQAKLRKEGYDGIHIAEAKSWIAFDSGQIKSTENRGTFDPKHGDINFSLPEASMDTLDEVLSKPDDTAWQRAKDWARGKAEDLRPAALGALQTRHVLELMEHHDALKGAKQYGEHMQALAADRNQLLTGAHDAAEHPDNMLKRGGATIAQDLRDFTFEKGPAGWFGRRTEASKNLASVQHGATIYGLDPSQPYQRLTFEDSRGGAVEWTQKGIKERIKEIRGQMRGRPGDDKSMMMDEVKRLRNIPKRENLRQQRWPDLVAQYQALPEKAKELYKQQRDWHSQMRDETEIALIKRIEALGQDVGANYVRSLQDRIRLQFEAQRNEGVYFPLDRNGEYWTSFTDKDGQQGFKMFETAKDADQAEKKLRAAGFTVDAQGRRDGTYRAKDAPSGTFVKDIVQMLKKAGASEKVQDDIYQMFLKTLPEMSMRKHSIHRRNIPGYSEDVLRAFSKNAFHGAHQLARLRHAHEMQSTIEAMQTSLDNYRRGGELGEGSATSALDVARGDALLSELKKRHDYIMSPKETQLANVANSIGFLYYLGASPASAIVNLTQNAQVTLPVLGAHHGWGKASRVLGAAVRDSLRTFGNIDRTLKTEDERQAYNVLRSRGDIDKTQSHTLAGLAEGSLMTTNPVWAKTMSAMTYMFHKAEVVNREAAGMAAYRLARSRGDEFNAAIQYASDIVNGTHFDYSAANRPRIMQNNAARIALQFKNYSMGMTWAMYRNLYHAFKGETPEVRATARKTLTGILGVTAVMAGAMGLPMINAMRFAGNAAHTLFGDDTPFDFDTEFRAWLSEHLGEDASKWVADGAVNRLGANISGRVSLSDLWFRDADKELEGKDAYYAMLESLAGPMGGLAKNFFIGSKMVGDGNVERGIETMMPKFAKDAMKATRFAHDGANTLRGDPILPDMSTPESFVQMLGFQPTRLAEQQRTNNAMKNYEQGILDRRASLLNALAMATKGGDDDERGDALAQIHAFNQQFPEIALKSDSIRQSLRARARYSAQSDNGVFINKKLAPRLRADVQGEATSP